MVIQALGHQKPFLAWLDNFKKDEHDEGFGHFVKVSQITFFLNGIYKRLRENGLSGFELVSNYKLFVGECKKFYNIETLASGFLQQQDTEEFLRFLLEKMNKEIHRFIDKTLDEQFQLRKNEIIISNKTDLQKLYYFTQLEEFVCENSHLKRREVNHVIDSNILVLDIPVDELQLMSFDINDCLRLLTNKKPLPQTADMRCFECRSRMSSRFRLINDPPQILFIKLTRCIDGYKKNTSVVELVIDNLNLNQLYGCNYLYDLYSIICHDGPNINAGHYTVYCRDFISNKWTFFNDELVERSIKLSEGTNHYNKCIVEGYILVYSRKTSLPNVMNLQPVSKTLKRSKNNEDSNAPVASHPIIPKSSQTLLNKHKTIKNIKSNSSIVINPYINDFNLEKNEDACDFINESMNDISIKDNDSQQDKSQK